MVVEKLYESENYLVVNKPFDMYINSDDESEKNTVTSHVALTDSHLSTSVRPIHFVQRLDYATSGVLCLAKNKPAAARACRLFERRETRKYYLAVVRGHVKKGVADIEYDVAVDEQSCYTSHKMMAVTGMATGAETGTGAKQAHSRLFALETGLYDQQPATVVLLKPITGRRHQLRVHCAAIGHCIVGDYTYSGKQDTAPHRMMLHATRLVLPLPTEHLDLSTKEPFFSDKQFTAKWTTIAVWQPYRKEAEFKAACDILDKNYELGLSYSRYFFKPPEFKDDGDKKTVTDKMIENKSSTSKSIPDTPSHGKGAHGTMAHGKVAHGKPATVGDKKKFIKKILI